MKAKDDYEALRKTATNVWQTEDGRYAIERARSKGREVYAIWSRIFKARVAENAGSMNEAREAIRWNREADATGGPDG